MFRLEREEINSERGFFFTFFFHLSCILLTAFFSWFYLDLRRTLTVTLVTAREGAAPQNQVEIVPSDVKLLFWNGSVEWILN